MLTLFLFLCSCSKPCNNWEYKGMISSCPPVTYGKIYLSPKNHFRELELEFSRGCSGIKMYLNAFSVEFPQNGGGSSTTKVLIQAGQESYEVDADRLEGGQRLILPQGVSENIICRLLNQEQVCISAGKYKSEISPQGFSKVYDKLVHNKTERSFFSFESRR